jgi:thiol-disulfide isomerase/thioredoxin
MMLMKKKMIYILVAIAILVAFVAAIIILKNGSSPNANYSNLPVNHSTMATLQSIADNTTLANAVLGGAASNFPSPVNAVPLSLNGKPAVVYIGADYCPYCAVTRWSLILALMRFGTISNLHYMASSSTDIYSDSPTFTFYNSTYSSAYITFDGVEYETRTGAPLQNLTPLETDLMTRFNGVSGGIPFIDFGNISVLSGAVTLPASIYKSNWTQVIAQLNNPNSKTTQALVGGADVFTVQICKMTNNTPASVCSQPYVSETARFLNG